MQILNAYWSGHLKTSLEIDKIPDYIDYLTLWFASPDINNNIDLDFLCSQYDEDKLIIEIAKLKNKGIKILLSIVDNPENQWDKINIEEFIINLNKKIIQWNLDGLDIMVESSMDSDSFKISFVKIIKMIRRICHKNIILTYSCNFKNKSNDRYILDVVKDKINWINILTFYTPKINFENIYNFYDKILKNKISICLKLGIKEDDYNLTLKDFKQITKWNSNKIGISIWTINKDTILFTEQNNLIYCDTIHKNLFELNNTYPNIIKEILKQFAIKILFTFDNISLKSVIDMFKNYIKK